jgi:hypothetical protein
LAGKTGSFGIVKIALVVILVIAIAEAAALWFLVLSPSMEASKPKRVLIVGNPSGEMLSLLTSEDYKMAGISVDKVVQDAQVSKETLSNADLVIMQGEEYCDNTLTAYSALRKERAAAQMNAPPWDQKNLKFVLIGNACSRSKNSQLVGWTALFFEATRIRDAGVFALSKAPLKQELIDGKFVVEVWDHPIFNGIANYGFYGSVFVFDNAPRASVLASIARGNVSMEDTIRGAYSGVPAVVKIGGDDLYYAFDAGNLNVSSRNLFLNSLLHMANNYPYCDAR